MYSKCRDSEPGCEPRRFGLSIPAPSYMMMIKSRTCLPEHYVPGMVLRGLHAFTPLENTVFSSCNDGPAEALFLLTKPSKQGQSQKMAHGGSLATSFSPSPIVFP